ncbi:hypothetical protein SMICM17S_11204 [Streptomyces microflavus]
MTVSRAASAHGDPCQDEAGGGVEADEGLRFDRFDHARLHRDAVPGEGARVPGALGPLGGVAQQGCGVAQPGRGRRRLAHGDDLRPACGERGGDRQQKGARAAEDHPAAGDDSPTLEQRLEPPGGEHTGQVPAGEGELAVVGAGRHQEGRCAQHDGLLLGRPAAVHGVDGEAVLVAGRGPHVVVQQQREPSGALVSGEVEHSAR